MSALKKITTKLNAKIVFQSICTKTWAIRVKYCDAISVLVDKIDTELRYSYMAILKMLS